MNKLTKAIIATLGGVDVAFSIFIPVSLVLLMITVVDSSNTATLFLLIIGLLSTIYRAIKYWVVK